MNELTKFDEITAVRIRHTRNSPHKENNTDTACIAKVVEVEVAVLVTEDSRVHSEMLVVAAAAAAAPIRRTASMVAAEERTYFE